jgi:hypothetical protein
MSALALYMPASITTLDPYKFTVALLVVFGATLLMRAMADWMQHSEEHDKIENELYAMRQQLEVLKKKMHLAEKNIDFTCGAVSEQAEIAKSHTEMTKAQAEEIGFACEIASSSYCLGPKSGMAYMEQPVMKYLEDKPPTTARQILAYLTENQSALDPKFFTYGSTLTRHAVNSCLYTLLHQGRLTKTDTTPPFWSTK